MVVGIRHDAAQQMHCDTFHAERRSRRQVEDQSVVAIVVTQDSCRLVSDPGDQEPAEACKFAPTNRQFLLEVFSRRRSSSLFAKPFSFTIA